MLWTQFLEACASARKGSHCDCYSIQQHVKWEWTDFQPPPGACSQDSLSALQRWTGHRDGNAFTNHFGATTSATPFIFFYFLPRMLNRLPPVPFCACVFIRWLSRSQKTPPERSNCKWMTVVWFQGARLGGPVCRKPHKKACKLCKSGCALLERSEQMPPAYFFSQKRTYSLQL